MCQQVKSFAERIVEAQEFMDLVREMRIAQKWYNSINRHDDRGTKASLEKSEKESKVDRWLEKHKDETRYKLIEK